MSDHQTSPSDYDRIYNIVRGTGFVTRGQADEITELLLATPPAAPAATEAPSVVRDQSEYLLGYTEGWNAAREIPAEVASDAAAVRMAFLHSTNRDADGYEWGVAKVRFGATGQVESFLWGAADSSDLDAAMPFHLRPDVLEAEAAAGGVLACGGATPAPASLRTVAEAIEKACPSEVDPDDGAVLVALSAAEVIALRNSLAAVGASVQPVPESLSDEQIDDLADDFKSQYTHGGTTFDEFDYMGFGKAVRDRMLASSTPTKGGEA